MNRYSRHRSQLVDHLSRERSEIYIGTHRHTGGSNRRFCITLIHDQRCPLLYKITIFGVLHSLEENIFREQLMTLFQVFAIFFSPHKAYVWNGSDKRFWILNEALLYQVSPKLTRHFIVLANFDRFRY